MFDAVLGQPLLDASAKIISSIVLDDLVTSVFLDEE